MAALAALALASPLAAQLPPPIEACLATRTAAQAAVVCPPAWQSSRVTEAQWMQALAHYVQAMRADGRAQEAMDALQRDYEPRNAPWFDLQLGLLAMDIEPLSALYLVEDALAGGLTLDDGHRDTILAFARTAAAAAVKRREDGAYPADLSPFMLGVERGNDRTLALTAYTMILTLAPDDAEASAGLAQLTQLTD
jgi:hypothetical protein